MRCMVRCLSLFLHPRARPQDFNMPNAFSVMCNAPPSMFAYPKAEEDKKDEKKVSQC